MVVGLDWGTQLWVSHTLVLGHQIWSGGPVQIYYMENGHQISAWTIWLGLVGVAGVAVLLRRDLPHFPWWVQVASGAVLGGILGNSLELLVVGHVVDFIQTPLPILGEGVGNPADAGVFAGLAVAGGGGLAVAAIHCLPEMLPGWLRHVAAAVLASATPLSMLLGSLWLYGAYGGGYTPPTTAITTTASSVPQITAIASATGTRTLAIRGGRVEWLSLHPTRWTPVTLPTRFYPPLVGPRMHPTAVTVTSAGVGLVGMSDGVVLAITPGADHASAVVADSLWSPVVALAGMGTIGHLDLLVSTTAGTYSVGLKGAMAAWWPHKEASAVAAPANSQGSWAAIVGGRLQWAAAAGSQGWWAYAAGAWQVASSTTLTEVWRPGSWFWVGAPAGSSWSQASARVLGPDSLLTEAPGGGIAVATSAGAVLQGAPGGGLGMQLHTVATSPLGSAAKPTGLVRTWFPTPGNVLILAAANEPLLVDGEPGWESLGGPAKVHLVADVGGSVVEVLVNGGVRAVAINPALGLVPSPGRSVPGWVGPALGLAVLVILLVLAGFATWRLPWRPRVAVFTAAGVVLFGFGGVAVGRFVIPPAARYTQSQVHQAWLNGTSAGSSGNWLVTPSQCAILTRALEWKGPVPTTLTTTVAIDGPRQAVPTCELQARQSAAQDVAAMRQPLNDQLNQNSISYFLYLNLGSNATAPVQAESQTACLALRGACAPTGNSGHFMAYYSVQLVFPPKVYNLWQKLMGGPS
ncbi:MAG: signal peptidase II [Candidatus Dormibacteria bacterium]